MKYFIWFVLAGTFLYWIIPFESQETPLPSQIFSHTGLTRWNDSTYSTYYYEPVQPLLIRYTFINNSLERIDVRTLPKSAAHLSGSAQERLSDILSDGCFVRDEEYFQNSQLIHIPIIH